MKEICERCNGTGIEVSDWDLTLARTNPKVYNDYRIEKEHGKNSGVISLLNVVSPLYFNDEGKELCYGCHGSGKSREFVQQEAENKTKAQADYFKNLIGSDLEIECPEDSQFITIQACCNDSDVMTDYFNNHKSLSIKYAIAIVPGKQRREGTARKAMVPFVDLYQPWDEWKWHKEDYSGGHGYWLESIVKGDYPYKAYDGREEVLFWYEVSFNSYTKKMKASKWLAEAMNKEIQIKEEAMPKEIIEEKKTGKYLVIDVPISLFNRIVELEDKQEFSGDVDYFNSLLEAAEVGKDKKSTKVKLDAQAYLYALKRFPEVEEVLSSNGDEKILLKSLGKVVSKMVTDGTKLFTDADFAGLLVDEEPEPKEEEKPVKKAEPKKTEVKDKPRDVPEATKLPVPAVVKVEGKYSRIYSVCDAIKANSELLKNKDTLAKEADNLYVAKSGKSSNIKESTTVTKMVTSALEYFGSV